MYRVVVNTALGIAGHFQVMMEIVLGCDDDVRDSGG